MSCLSKAGRWNPMPAKITVKACQLHGLYLVFVPWTEPDIKISKHQYTNTEWDDCKILKTVIREINRVTVKSKELTYHPV